MNEASEHRPQGQQQQGGRRFSSRLFWLFLLTAIIPALILAIAGYYLSVQGNSNRTEQQVISPNQQLAKYYNDLLFSQLENSCEQFSSSGVIDSQYCDFGFIISDSLINSPTETATTRAILITAARERSQGWVKIADSYYQYLSHATGYDTLITGFVHTEPFGELLELVQLEYSTQSRSRALRSEYVFFLLLLFAGLSILIVIAAYFLALKTSHKLARPLEELAKAAKGIASGDFKQMVKPTGDIEIRELIESFNSMAIQLEQTAAKLTQTERVAAWRQVARRFAHELKNPIQPILISLYQIEKKLTGSDQFELISEPLQAATDELNHLTTLAERFSDLAKMPEVRLETIELAPVLLSVTQLYHEKNDTIKITLVLPDQPITIRADRTYLREALHNIVLNAQDACLEGGLIEVSLQTNENQVTIAVRDNGIGMDRKTAASASLPYFTSKAKGTGLGLAIVERSVSEMNGRLQVKSAPGKGTTISLVFPQTDQQEIDNA